ncbi:cutinase family protein [Microbacterium phyllosphaerae]|uniref:cutinase family protein n=1 Tax=Microbacterium phyllosphaerae TaxID=124798 RepID=UPI002167EF33|nr:cutinase family protein [Microbacterium phyllosphaerae]MCS3442212.1 hypothetical protein [Microbacterium phyllosphaerae]
MKYQSKTLEQLGARRRKRGALASMLAALIVSMVGLGGAPANAALSSNMCDFAIVVGVRGTGAPAGSNAVHDGRVWTNGGLGDQVAALRSSLINLPDMPFYFLGLNYPASPVLQPSIQQGVSTLIWELNYINEKCPYAPIILAGHSQGAAVISHMLASPGFLKPEAKAGIRNVVLFGDPEYKTGMVTNVANKPNNGLLSAQLLFPKTALADYKYWGYPEDSNVEQWLYKVREYCNAGDYFCQSNFADSDFTIHNQYKQYAPGAAKWIQYTLTWFGR